MGHALLIVIIEPDTRVEAIEQRVQELMQPYDQDYEGERESLPIPCDCTQNESRAPDPACEECGGTGETTMTFNPQEAWDWYTPGGRWDRAISGELTDQARPTSCEHDAFSRNTVLVRDIPPGFEVWAVLTPNGEWHGGGGYDEKDTEAWASEQAAILQGYPDHLAVAVDFHY